MIESTKFMVSKRKPKEPTATIVVVVACLFVMLGFFNNNLLGVSGNAVLSALRWLVMVPAFILAFGGFSRLNFSNLSQIVFLFAIFASVVAAPDVYWALICWVRVLCPFAIACSVLALKEDGRKYLYKGILFTFICFLIISFLGSFTHYATFYQGGSQDIDDSRLRLTGFTFHPNILGYISAVLICFGTMKLLVIKNTSGEKLFWSGVIVVSAYVLYEADSRTGMLSAFLGLGVLFLKKYLLDGARNDTLGFAISVVLVLATMAALVSPLLTALGIFSFHDDTARYELSTLARINLWNIGWSDFLQYPVAGIGLGTTITSQTTARFIETDLPYFHSVLINYLATTGVIGSLGVLMMIFVTEIKVFMARNSFPIGSAEFAQNEEQLQFCVTSMVVTLVFSITEGALQGIYPTFLMFFLSTVLLPNAGREKLVSRRAQINPSRTLPGPGRPLPRPVR